MQEDSKWLNDFYQEVNAGKRMELWQKHGCTEQTEGDIFREQLLYARYGKKKKKEDTFIGYLMQMKYLSESTGVDFSRQRKKQAVEIINGLYLLDVENRSRVEQEILQAELKNTFLTFMDVSKKGRGFTSLVFGMGQLSEEGIAKKIAEQISAIAFTMPHKFQMDREFAVLQKAALEAFRQQYPEREHFLMK